MRAALAVFVFALAAAATSSAQTADRVGIFFAPGFPDNERNGEVLPIADTAYLVLLDPSLPDVGGWEMRIVADGPVAVLGWQLTGQAVNFDTPPSFAVGLGSPLPAAPQVVLASSDLLITAAGPVMFSLVPTYRPSLPGEIVYIPFENKEPLTPLTTFTGTPEVAWYNRDVPVCDVSPSTLPFGAQPLGSVTRRTVTITNVGGGLLPVDPGLVPGCDGFRLAGLYDPVMLQGGESLAVDVEFAPSALAEYQCTLDLGTPCGTVNLWGQGREVRHGLEISPPVTDFGSVAIGGDSSLRSIHITNTGEVAEQLDFTSPPSCAEFVVYPGGQVSLSPGSTLYVHAYFSPSIQDTQTCEIVLADGFQPLVLTGSGYLPDNLVIEPASIDFGVVEIWTGHAADVTVTNAGLTAIVLGPHFANPCDGFTFSPEYDVVTLNPGDALTLHVQFLPTHEGVYSCLLSLGLGKPFISITGAANPVDAEVRVQPAALDFGGVAAGSYNERTVTVVNETVQVVTLTPSTGPPGDGFSLTGSSATITLAPGGRAVVTVKFNPGDLGPHAGELTLGADLPVVPLSGVGEEPVVGWQIQPTDISFTDTYVGSSTSTDVYVTNTGNGVAFVAAAIPQGPDGAFVVIYGESTTLMPGETHRLRVMFRPPRPEVFQAELVISPAGTVPLTGAGATDLPHCFVHTTDVEFGTVLVGSTVVRSFFVTNTGNAGFDIDPVIHGQGYIPYVFTGAPQYLSPGETMELTVAYNPVEVGQHVFYINLGPIQCANIILWGEGSASLAQDEDLVGVWFDEGLTTGIRSDLRIGEAVPAWLAMLNPSQPEGIGGWELRLDLGDGLYLTDYALEGATYNFEDPPSFFVGIAEPLPWAPQVILARFDFLVTDTQTHSVDLLPLWMPSLPGRMAWVYGPDFQLKEMHPVSGTPSVAWLSASTPVATTAPTPNASLAGGRVELTWPLPVDGADGCHVYRSAAGGETRLNRALLAPTGGGYVFVDDVAGLPAGATVAYSYGIVRGGAEIARSPAAEVVLPGAATTATHLLPNRPNPFNPATEIHFELARAERVRIAVYDVTGRLVAGLEDGPRAAGAHHVTWNGRDAAGRGVPSGAYYVRLETARTRDTRKIMLLK